jgi:hypothetical protein
MCEHMIRLNEQWEEYAKLMNITGAAHEGIVVPDSV